MVIDEVEQEVLILADSEVGLLHEHGVTIYLSKGRWRFDDGERFDRYSGKFIEQKEERQRGNWRASWEAVFPLPGKNAPIETDVSGLFGVWRYDAAETARVLKQCGAPKREIDEALSPGQTLRNMGWYYSPAKYKWLEKRDTIRQWEVAKYERKGNRYEIHTKSDDALNNILWCDGKLMMSVWGKHVFARVKKVKATKGKG